MPDRIEKQILLRAPLQRVWRALSNSNEIGAWFGAALDPVDVVPGARLHGRITTPGYEHLEFEAVVERVEPPRLLSWRWPLSEEPPVEPDEVVRTLVEFRLDEVEDGTRLTIVESGFDAVPEPRRTTVFRDNEGGWAFQLENVRRHVAGAP